jgi:4-aminobutyrate aminotransferase / (S)-3-amino-2-methylpropionate transaminase / 5-aminovalerate transaminase
MTAVGPNTEALLTRRRNAVPRGPFHVTELFAARARGSRLIDADGQEYIDFTGGIGVQNLGHVPERVAAAIHAQVDQLMHSCFHVVMYEPYVALAEALNRITPGDFAKKTLLVNSGAEANENAVKIARVYTGRTGIIAFDHSFHGRTLLGMTLTGKTVPYKQGMGPFAPEVYHAPYPYPYHAPKGMTPAEYGRWCLERLELLMQTETSPDNVAAVIIEPVLGEGGFVVPPDGFLPGLQALCRRHGILLIADEIQTGFGRTGHLFASEHFGITPDLITLGKSLAAGMPLTAVVGRAEVMDAPSPGSLGGTYGGNPVACAAALAVIETFEKEPVLEQARHIGDVVARRFAAFRERFPIVGDARGVGPMQALELVTDRATRAPATAQAGAIMHECLEQGLLVMKAGMHNQVIRTLMPLTIREEDLERGLDILEAAITKVAGQT